MADGGDRDDPDVARQRMEVLEALKLGASSGAPFTEAELESAITSLRNAAGEFEGTLDWAVLRTCLKVSAHESYKDWTRTEEVAKELADIFVSPSSAEFREMFKRVFRDGHWDRAAEAAAARGAETRPWIVLVTGLNGIRKTTCMYQPWFKSVLHSAIVEQGGSVVPLEELPDGNNSFFRQLDHIIATVANEEFRTLYTVEDVDRYASLKDGIFGRYRKLAEMWGILLVQQAKTGRMNIMVETSGRDPGMFHYIDHFFPDESYRKLVIHFEINDIGFAEHSVDSRMLREMADGQRALDGTVQDIIGVNAGGPYGSKVLKQVLIDSNKVWEQVAGEGTLATSWYKASISIEASDAVEWTAHSTLATGGKPTFPISRL